MTFKTKLPLALLAAAFAAALVYGCGGDDEGGASEADQDAITALVAEVERIGEQKDAAAFCDLLQPSGVAKVFPSKARCVTEFRRVLSNAPPPASPRIESIEVEGSRAKVNFEGQSAPTVLVKEKGRWYLPLPDPDRTVTEGA